MKPEKPWLVLLARDQFRRNCLASVGIEVRYVAAARKRTYQSAAGGLAGAAHRPLGGGTETQP